MLPFKIILTNNQSLFHWLLSQKPQVHSMEISLKKYLIYHCKKMQTSQVRLYAVHMSTCLLRKHKWLTCMRNTFFVLWPFRWEIGICMQTAKLLTIITACSYYFPHPIGLFSSTKSQSRNICGAHGWTV